MLKNKTMVIRLSEEEFEAVKAERARSGVPTNEMIRRLLRDHLTKPKGGRRPKQIA